MVPDHRTSTLNAYLLTLDDVDTENYVEVWEKKAGLSFSPNPMNTQNGDNEDDNASESSAGESESEDEGFRESIVAISVEDVINDAAEFKKRASKRCSRKDSKRGIQRSHSRLSRTGSASDGDPSNAKEEKDAFMSYLINNNASTIISCVDMNLTVDEIDVLVMLLSNHQVVNHIEKMEYKGCNLESRDIAEIMRLLQKRLVAPSDDTSPSGSPNKAGSDKSAILKAISFRENKAGTPGCAAISKLSQY